MHCRDKCLIGIIKMKKSDVQKRPRVSVQHDWYEILRTPGEKAWFSFTKEGEKSVYGELSTKQSAQETVQLQATDGFQADFVNSNVLQLQYENKTTYFHPPIKTFKSIHKKAVRCLDISAGGSLGVSCSEDESLCVWQSEDGKIRRLLDGHVSDVTHCRFFPSGVVVLSGGIDMRLKIWSAEDGTCPVTLVKHKGAITDTAIIDRGKNIISCSRDGSSYLWDCGTAVCLTELTRRNEASNSSVINACSLKCHQWKSDTIVQDRSEREVGTEGKMLVLTREDGIVEAIDVYSRDQVFQWTSCDAVNSCCFVDENRLVLGQQNGDVICLDVRNPGTPEKILNCGKAVVNCVQPYFKNMILVGRGDGSCSCISLDEMATTKELIGPNLDSIYDISTANKFIYTACRDGAIRQYCLEKT